MYNQTDGSFVIINPLDEKGTNGVKFEHGGINVKDRKYTIAYVGRVVDYERTYTSDHHMIPDFDVIPIPHHPDTANFDINTFETELRLLYNRM